MSDHVLNDDPFAIIIICVVYRVFQKDRPKRFQVSLLGGQKLPRGQKTAEQMSVLSVPKMSASRHGQGGGSHGLAERSPRPVAVKTKVSARVASEPARVAHYGTSPCPRGHESGFFVVGLFTSNATLTYNIISFTSIYFYFFLYSSDSFIVLLYSIYYIRCLP